MKFLDATGVTIIWNKIKKTFLSKSLVVIEQDIPIREDIVRTVCMANPTGIPSLVKVNNVWQIGLVNGNVFNPYTCMDKINIVIDNIVKITRILIINDRIFVPIENAAGSYEECSSLEEAFEKLYVNWDRVITTDELNEVLV